MTLDEFRELAEAWGADIARWPEHLRASAGELAREPDAAAVLAEAERFDGLIRAAKPKVSADRVNQAVVNVAALVAAESRRKGFHGVFLRPWWLMPAASFATAAVLGVSLGLMKPFNTPHGSNDAPVITMILDAESFGPDWLLR
jgi:hypothetical protein